MKVKVCVTPELTLSLKNSGKDKQYGLKQRVTGYIHVEMVNTLISMYTDIYHKDPKFWLLERGQLFYRLSWKKATKNSIFL